MPEREKKSFKKNACIFVKYHGNTSKQLYSVMQLMKYKAAYKAREQILISLDW